MKVLSRISIPEVPVSADEPTSKDYVDNSLDLTLAGDVTGQYHNNMVEKLRGRVVAPEQPEANSSLVWTGTQWEGAWPTWPGVEELEFDWDETQGAFHTDGHLYVRRALPTNQATIVITGRYTGTGWTADLGSIANPRLRPPTDTTVSLQWPGSGTAVSMVVQANGLVYLFNTGTSNRTGVSYHNITTPAV